MNILCIWHRIMGNWIITKHLFGVFKLLSLTEGGNGSLTERCLLTLSAGRPLWPGWPDVSQCAWGLVFSIKAQHGRRKRTYPRIFLFARIPVQFQQLWSRYVKLWHCLRNINQWRSNSKSLFWKLSIVHISWWFQLLLFTVIGCVE